jgi:predicted transcriptional regulator
MTDLEKLDDISRVMTLHMHGFVAEEIAETLGATVPEVRKALRAAQRDLAKRNLESAVYARDLELLRLDELWRRTWQQIDRGNFRAIDQALKIVSAKAKMMGLDAPEKLQIEVGMTEDEAQAATDRDLAIMMLRKCAMQGYDPKELAQEAVDGMDR